MGFSISFKKGTKNTSISHNNRELTDRQKTNDWHKHIDFTKSDENIYLEQTNLADKYEELFGEVVEKYNAKQKRADRKIEDYLAKVRKDKKLEPQREFIVQIGILDDFQTNRADGSSTGISKQQAEQNRVIANKILVQYYKEFQERNPNLAVYNAVIHNDEISPHLHLNIVPVAEGYKRGVQKQPSFNKALVQQGIHADKDNGRVLFNNFRNQEVDSIERLMNDYGWKRDIVGTNKIKDIHEYKEIMSEISELRQTAVKERESISAEMRYISKQREKNEREKALVASEKAKIEEEKKSIIDLEKELAVVFQKDPVPLNSFEKLSDGSYRLSSADFVDLYQKASNATNSKKYADMANESLGNTLDKNIALFDKNMALEQENSFLKNQQKVDVSAVVAENKKLKEENRSLRRRLTQLKNAFQKSITRLSIRFGLVEKDMGISEELKILDQEKTLASQQNAPERNIGRSENEMEW
ncbi:recombinase [Enterococcus sp. HMSC065H03]|uniref:Recombinase n=26 Tax=Bacteria TaxID=2 RepID=A0A7V8C7E5_ENTFC|nr:MULTISPECIES: plasmid recombination protein [Enterococcus]KAB7572081.1 recombinase [Enterococcus faecium]MBG7760539.1 plasmid recombination protein [Enterococcus faecium]MBG7836791.1 plasmid recombination protein [Enterococcus faecium]MBH0818193.1 plasmid recombination protein [Enterococcus faecium]MBH0835181.1 plasmid recombination protein [Enterococcus faecium]